MANQEISRQKVQAALRRMAEHARKANEEWRKELKVCHDAGLANTHDDTPASLTERFAHWSMAELMLHIAVSELLYSGHNDKRVDRYVKDLIAGERWPTEN